MKPRGSCIAFGVKLDAQPALVRDSQIGASAGVQWNRSHFNLQIQLVPIEPDNLIHSRTSWMLCISLPGFKGTSGARSIGHHSNVPTSGSIPNIVCPWLDPQPTAGAPGLEEHLPWWNPELPKAQSLISLVIIQIVKNTGTIYCHQLSKVIHWIAPSSKSVSQQFVQNTNSTVSVVLSWSVTQAAASWAKPTQSVVTFDFGNNQKFPKPGTYIYNQWHTPHYTIKHHKNS